MHRKENDFDTRCLILDTRKTADEHLASSIKDPKVVVVEFILKR